MFLQQTQAWKLFGNSRKGFVRVDWVSELEFRSGRNFARFPGFFRSKSAPEVSASELVYLRAQVWIFEKKLEQEKNCLANVTVGCHRLLTSSHEKFISPPTGVVQKGREREVRADSRADEAEQKLPAALWRHPAGKVVLNGEKVNLTAFYNQAIWIQRRVAFHRENNEVLQNEVECLQGEVDKNRVILVKWITRGALKN